MLCMSCRWAPAAACQKCQRLRCDLQLCSAHKFISKMCALLQDLLVSRISRKSINLLKEHFKQDMSKDDWRLVVKLKGVFRID